MANPAINTLVPQFNRMYIVVNPNPYEGPPTLRVSNPDEIGSESGGVKYDYDGIAPINVDVKPGMGQKTSTVTTSMDIAELSNRVN